MSQSRGMSNSMFSYIQEDHICQYSTKAIQKGIVSTSSMKTKECALYHTMVIFEMTHQIFKTINLHHFCVGAPWGAHYWQRMAGFQRWNVFLLVEVC